MEKVLEQARLLAEAIAESDVYQKMHQCENDAMKDAEATRRHRGFCGEAPEGRKSAGGG